MTTSVLYTSEDSGAPVLLSGVAGSLTSILLACLVNGYGAKSPLGWTCPYYDAANSIYVFRNNPTTGSGGFIRVNDSGVGYTQPFMYGIKGYGSMSSINSGIAQMPLVVSMVSRKSHTNSTSVAVKWRLIGDDRGFYIVLLIGETTYNAAPANKEAWIVYCGDIVSFYPKEQKVFSIIGNSENNAFFGTSCGTNFYSTNDANQYCMLSRNPKTGKLGAISVRSFQMTAFDNNSESAIGRGIASAPVVSDIPHCVDTCLVLADRTIVGKLPGLYGAIYDSTNESNISNYVEKYITYGTDKYLQSCLNIGTLNATTLAYYGLPLIKVGAGFRP